MDLAGSDANTGRSFAIGDGISCFTINMFIGGVNKRGLEEMA